MNANMVNLLLLVGIILPVIWSAGIWTVKKLVAMPLDDRTEKLWLSVLIIPVVTGVSFLVLAELAPVKVPDLPPEGEYYVSAEQYVDDALTDQAVSQSRLNLFPWFLAGGYFLGFAWNLSHLTLTRRYLDRVARQANSNDIGYRVTHHDLTPFVAPNHAIIIPHKLISALGPRQLDLILAHEQAHLQRKDPSYFSLLAWIEVVFWMNPFVRLQVRDCRLAAECAVDQYVTSSKPDDRKLYANTLVDVLKYTSSAKIHSVPTIFSPRKRSDYRMRISRVMRPQKTARHPFRMLGLVGVMMVPMAVGQWALAENNLGTEVKFSTLPLSGKKTSPFGQLPDSVNKRNKNHRGLDIKGATGTDIVAPAAGRVIEVQNVGNYGNRITIDHGLNTVTRYAHLNSFSVKKGDAVVAGQVIGQVGSTGKSTGPHLHFEVIIDGQFVDPETVLVWK